MEFDRGEGWIEDNGGFRPSVHKPRSQEIVLNGQKVIMKYCGRMMIDDWRREQG